MTYGKEERNDLWIKSYKLTPNHTKITFVYNDKEYNIISPLLGDFNVYNLAAALLTVISTGKSMEEIIPNVQDLKI